MPEKRKAPAGTGANQGDHQGTRSVLECTASALGLPRPPVLSATGLAIVAAGSRGFRAAIKPEVPVPKVGVPTVTGRVVVDLTDVVSEREVADRFWPVSGAPDGVPVTVKLPPQGRVSLAGALRGWDRVPAVNFDIEHPDPRSVQAAVAELRHAVDTRRAELLDVTG